ncbi:hypothetical protein [Sphingomonas sp. 3-13AW]|uniref:hypothetical protein n=1 Tax=Sphingomonas sp. 3-13AW TaxID=3050450 RepID=UPI003BB65671
MSSNEWESGTISIPRTEWAALKATLREAHNAEQRRRLAVAVQLQEGLIKAAAGQRNVDWRLLAEKVLDDLRIHDSDRWVITWAVFEPNRQKARAANGGQYVDPMSLKGSAGRPPKPTKAMFPEANGKTMMFEISNGTITLDDKARTIHWYVTEGNHAVERARSHPVAKALFLALARMKWDTKCGGEIVGNDEYNQEDRDAGGGSNYVTARYGRAEADWKKSLELMSLPSRGTRLQIVNNFYGSPQGFPRR